MGKVEIIDYMKSAIDSDLGAGWFNVEVVFHSLDDAFAAKQEFLDAGYLFEILFDRIDVYSNAAFVAVSRPTGTATLYELFDEASEFAWRLGGMADCASITPEPDTDTAGMAGKAS